MFKIAYGAGHYINTAGKRLPKELDATQTREWTLNDRVARYFEEAAKKYEGVELLRVDDATGKTDIPLATRCKKANDWGADFYLSIHHNAGINLGSGGGVVAFSYKEGTTGAKYRDAIYNACISAGAIKGNRSNPTQAKNFYVLKNTKAPAVLMEYGFMDSKVDAPIILTEAYSKLVANATMDGIAQIAGLKKKAVEESKPIAVDGKWGRETTTRLQEIFGTTKDGEISNQWAKYKDSNPGLTGGWEWVEKPNGKGSQLIKKMQEWAGMPTEERDGEWGPKTCKAFQQKLGTTKDGKVSKPSQMVKALQRWANEQ